MNRLVGLNQKIWIGCQAFIVCFQQRSFGQYQIIKAWHSLLWFDSFASAINSRLFRMSTDVIVLVAWTAMVIALQVWLFMAVPPKDTVKKYSRAALLRSLLSFTNTWTNNFDAVDIDAIQRYRTKAIRYLFIVILSSIALCIYFYLRYLTEVEALRKLGRG